MAREERRQVAHPEPRVGVRRAHRANVPRAIGRQVVAEPLGAGHLRDAVRPRQPRPDGLAHARVDGRGRAARGDGSDRVEDRRVPGAATEDAAEAVEDLPLGGLRDAREEVVRGHQHRGGAGAALGAAAGEERLLERRQACVRRQAFDRVDPPSLDLAGGHQARAHLLAVQPDGARSAVARVAADLRAGQAEVLAEHVDEASAPVGADLDVAAVDREPEARLDDHAATSAIARRTSVSAASQR